MDFVSGRLVVEAWRTRTVFFPSVLIRARCMSANNFLVKYDALRALFDRRDIPEIKPIYGI